MLMPTGETLGFCKIKEQTIAMHGISSIKAFVPKISLLRNPEFHLIHVLKEDDGERCSMTVVTPGLHRPTRKLVVEQGYYTISHLWGPEEEWKPWTDHGIIRTDGETVRVNIRLEKKNGLLRLLSAVQGFWWIDVFCAQSKTPPSIMGDVYRFCNQCFALIDFPSDGFSRIEAIEKHLESFESTGDVVETYKDRINGRMVSENQSWHESLDDILGGWYEGDPTDIKTLADFLSCQWFARVWTLQEYLLPCNLIFMSEDNPENCFLDRLNITSIMMTLGVIASEALVSLTAGNNFYSPLYSIICRAQYERAAVTPGAARCQFDMARFDDFQLYTLYENNPYDFFDYVQCFETPGYFDAENFKGFCKLFRHIPDFQHGFLLLVALQGFARLPRRSVYRRDYIYGLLGLLGMDIPMADNDEEIWALFRKITQKTIPLLKVPEKSLLAGAKDMQDVYRPVLESIRALMWSAE